MRRPHHRFAALCLALIITVSGSTIACLDPRSGEERWTAVCGDASYNGHTPAIRGDLRSQPGRTRALPAGA